MSTSANEGSDGSDESDGGRVDRASNPGSRAVRRGNAERRRASLADLPNEPFVEHDADGVATRLGPVATYTKGLPPDDSDGRAENAGVLPAEKFDRFAAALDEERYGDLHDLTDVDYEGDAGERPLVNPSAASSYATTGVDPNNVPIGRTGPAGEKTDAAPRFDGARAAAEVIELYWQALARDVPFSEYEDSEVVGSAIAELRDTDGYDTESRPLPGDRRTAFRGVLPGAQQGPYVSQFLYLPVPRGAQTRPRTFRPFAEDVDFLTDFDRWRDVQNGRTLTTREELGLQETESSRRPSQFLNSALRSLGSDGGGPEPPEAFPPELLRERERHVTTGRDLATYVRANPSQQPYLAAALALQNYGAPLDPGIPDGEDGPLGGGVPGTFVDFGRTEYQTAVVDVVQVGLRAAWYRKWLVHRRLRPEEYGGRVEVARRDSTAPPDWLRRDDVPYDTVEDAVPDALLRSEAVSRTETETGAALLPQAYPNGSPTHPSYPAGHATTAGACTTVLKAFFDTDIRFGRDGGFRPEVPASVLADADDGSVRVDGVLRPNPDSPERLDLVDGPSPTIEHELNKLATNMSIGRNWAGIHYRTDATSGYLLGERVALAYLDDRLDATGIDGTLTVPTFFGADRYHDDLRLDDIELVDPSGTS